MAHAINPSTWKAGGSVSSRLARAIQYCLKTTTKQKNKNKKSAPTKSKKKKKEMTQRVKVPAAKPDYHSSIPS